MPQNPLRRFVLIIAKPDHLLDLALSCLPVEVGWCIVNRVAIKDDQGFYLTGITGGFQGIQRLVGRLLIGEESNGFVKIAQQGIHGSNQLVHGIWLTLASDHQTLAFVSNQVLDRF